MTIKRLSKYFYLKKRVENYKKRIEELEKIVLTSANYNQVGNKTSHISPVELKAENLIKLKNLLEKNYYKLVDEELFIENYISKIKDESIKAIITMRFIECKTWDDVAKSLNYSRTTPYTKLINFLKTNKEDK